MLKNVVVGSELLWTCMCTSMIRALTFAQEQNTLFEPKPLPQYNQTNATLNNATRGCLI